MKAMQRPLTYQLLTLPIGIGLLGWLFYRQDWQKISLQFQSVNYFWVLPVLGVTIANYAFRALRWRIFLPEFSFFVVFRALLVGYFVNLALPRVGEVMRIWALQKNKPFLWQGLGAVVAERALDVLCLAVIMGVFLLLNPHFLTYIALPTEAQNIGILSFLVILGVFVLYKLWVYLQKRDWGWWQDFRRGLSFLWKARRQGEIWIYTILIWWTYTAMSYYWFFALPATSHLGWNVAFAMLALGTVSRVVPLQGNSAGVYHSLVLVALSLYGVAETPAFALTLLIHTTQLLFNLFVGGICLLWLIFEKS
jgi:hypothetical protein